MGLLKPCYVDEQTHYRYHDIKQNARLDMIQYMKELGMELKEIPVPEIVQGSLAVVIWYSGKDGSDSFSWSAFSLYLQQVVKVLYWMDIFVKVI